MAEDLVGEQEIAQRLGVKPGTVHQWRKRELLPAPKVVLSGVPIWEWTVIEGWAQATGRLTTTESQSPVLPGSGLEVLQAIASSPLGREFYLAGGTALALQIEHRISRDLGFLTRKPSSKVGRDRILSTIGRLFLPNDYRVTLRELGQVDLFIRGVKVTFRAYPFALEEPLIAFGSARVAAPVDIAAMKAYTMGRRAAGRDYLDLYYVFERGVIRINDLVRKAKRMFVLEGSQLFDPAAFARQLASTDDLEDKELALEDVLDKGLTWETVESRLDQEATKWMQEQIVEPGGEQL